MGSPAYTGLPNLPMPGTAMPLGVLMQHVPAAPVTQPAWLRTLMDPDGIYQIKDPRVLQVLGLLGQNQILGFVPRAIPDEWPSVEFWLLFADLNRHMTQLTQQAAKELSPAMQEAGRDVQKILESKDWGRLKLIAMQNG